MEMEVPEEHRAAVVETSATSITAVCICKQANLDGKSCNCTSSFAGLPTSNSSSLVLSAQVQCNGVAKVSSFKVGGTQVKDSVAQAPAQCKDKCGEYHKLLNNYDVSSMVASGELEVEMEVQGLDQ